MTRPLFFSLAGGPARFDHLRFATRAALLASSLLGACHYDLDELFEGELLDGGMPDASDIEPPPDQLINLWQGAAFSNYNDACAACAAAKCGDKNSSCKGDPECVKLTRCIAASTDPVTQAVCRAQATEWLSGDIFGRDVGGPYAQCVMQDKCTEECGSRTNYQCVGGFTWPTTNDEEIPFRFRFNEAFTLEEVADMQVKVCRADDLLCAVPTFTGQTDANGEVELKLRTSLRTFQGYLELTKKTDNPMTTIYPSLVRLGWPITQAGVTNITVISEFSVSLNVAISMVDPDPERGLLQVRFQSCTGFAAPGVSFTTSPSDEASRYWYADADGIPNFTETKTFTIGAGGVINAIGGRHTITATVMGPDGVTPVKVAQAAAPVRAGYMTIVLIPPMGTN